MAEDEDLDEEAEDGEDDESRPKKGGKKTLFIVIGVVVLLILGVAGALLVGLPDSATETAVEEDETAVEEEQEEPLPVEEVLALPGDVFYELPELLVDLNSVSRRTAFLRLNLTLALTEESDRARVEKLTPRIVDHILAYLREVRAEEISGSAGMHRLREELLKRAAIAVAPAKVQDLLFTEVPMQ